MEFLKFINKIIEIKKTNWIKLKKIMKLLKKPNQWNYEKNLQKLLKKEINKLINKFFLRIVINKIWKKMK